MELTESEKALIVDVLWRRAREIKRFASDHEYDFACYGSVVSALEQEAAKFYELAKKFESQ